VCLGDLSFFVDHVGDAACVLVFRGVRRAVRDADGLLRVAEQGEGEIELLREVAILVDGIEADAEDLRVFGLVFGVEVPEPGTLTRSTRGVGLGIEPEHDLLPEIVGEAHPVALVVGDVEVGSAIAGIQHLRFSSKDHVDDATKGHAAIVSA
jgi:hypothetical protein